MTMLLYPFIALSALGLILSILAHFGALLGLNVPSAAMGLHIGIFVVWFPAVLVSNSLIKGYDRKDFWKVVLRGAPKWMQYMVYAFMGYAAINFLIFMFFAPGDPTGSGGMPPSVVRGFSGHWMAFYSAALAILYSAVQIQKNGLNRKCPNGHYVSREATFCEKCGEVVFD